MSDEAKVPPARKTTALLRGWLGLTRIAPCLLTTLARRAHNRQKADPARLAERFGTATLDRPAGQLLWIHAASVGEVTSVSALANRIVAEWGVTLLVTTTTATSAALVPQRVPGALHQFLPVDTPLAVTRFLAHWRPDAALFVEGDLWPRLMGALAERNIPVALINARPSKTRNRAPRSFAALMQGVALVTVQDESLVAEFRDLGLDPQTVHAPGNLKADIPPPKVDPTRAAEFRRAAEGRPLWAAASTHPGEEEIVLDAHATLTPALLLLVPRHPERGPAIAAELARRGLRFSHHSAGTAPSPDTQVHLLDAVGELGAVYDAAGLALLGGSLVPGPGGHTPYEAAALGCAILSGPHLRNIGTAYDTLCAAGAARVVQDGAELDTTLAALLADPEAVARMGRAAMAEQHRQAGAAARTLALLTQDRLGATFSLDLSPGNQGLPRV